MWWWLALAVAGEVNAGWGGIEVKGDTSSFDAHLLLQARSQLSASEGEVSTLSTGLFRARPMVRFHHGPLVMFFQTELVGPPVVLDARADLTPSEHVFVSVGQMIVPFTRAWNTPLPLVQAPERSSNNTTLAPGRRAGGFAQVQATDGRVQALAGIYDNDPNGTDRAGLHAPMGLVRVQLNPWGALPANELEAAVGPADTKLGVGVAVLADEVDDGTGLPAQVDGTGGTAVPTVGGDLHRLTATGDYGFQSAGFTSYGEVFARVTEGGGRGWGASAQVAQFVVPTTLYLGSRFTAADDGVDDDVGPRLTPEGYLGWTLRGTNALVLARYAFSTGGSLADAHSATIHTQLRF